MNQAFAFRQHSPSDEALVDFERPESGFSWMWLKEEEEEDGGGVEQIGRLS